MTMVLQHVRGDAHAMVSCRGTVRRHPEIQQGVAFRGNGDLGSTRVSNGVPNSWMVYICLYNMDKKRLKIRNETDNWGHQHVRKPPCVTKRVYISSQTLISKATGDSIQTMLWYINGKRATLINAKKKHIFRSIS